MLEATGCREIGNSGALTQDQDTNMVREGYAGIQGGSVED